MEHLYSAVKLLLRRRISAQEHLHFEPILSLIDLTCLALSPVLGTGIFAILTYSSKYLAGPSSLLSFLIAAVASCLGGLCFIELSTRFPNSGPSYAYIYMTLGELPAFLVAWSMLLEYGFCSALSMRSFVQYVQFLMNQSDNSTSQALPAGTTTGASHTNLMPYLYSSYSSLTKGQHADAHHSTHVHHPRLSAVPANTRDDLETSAFLALLFLAVFLLRSRGIKFACFVSNLFTFFALLLLAGLLIVCTIYFVKIENWTSETGFFQHGIHGVFNGAALCFFSFIGYDIICSNVVKCKDTERYLPSAISLSFLVGLISTFLCAVIYTLSVPVSAQDTFASFSQLFTGASLFRMQYLIVLAGFLVSVSTTVSLFQANNMLLIHLASHGLLPKWFYQSNACRLNLNKFKTVDVYVRTPLLTSLFTFLFFVCVSVAFNNDSIICMLGVGTLINYASSALAVLLLRYDKLEKLPLDLEKQNLTNGQPTNSNYSLSVPCSKCLNLNRFYQNSSKPSFMACSNHHWPANDQQSVQEPGLQLIVALPSSFYYRQYYKQTFNKIKRSWSDCHLQSKICSFPSTSSQIRSTIPNANGGQNTYKEFNPLTENVVYQRDASLRFNDELTCRKEDSEEDGDRRIFANPQLTACYVDKGYASSLEFDFNLNYLKKLPTIETEMRVKYILFITIVLMVAMGLCTSRNDQLLWLMSVVGIRPVYWPIELISCLLSASIIYQLVRLTKQPMHQRRNQRNALPCVPLLPTCALWMHIHLALCLSMSAWLTFIIWSLIGFFVYMLFSIWNSKEGSLSFQIDEELESQNTLEETEHILEAEEIDKLSFD